MGTYQSWCMRLFGVSLLLLLLVGGPTRTFADAPGTRGPDTTVPQGSMAPDAAPQRSAPAPEQFTLDPRQDTAPAAPEQFAPAREPKAPDDDTPPATENQSSNGSSWLGRTLNFGNWMTDAGLGVGVSMFSTANESLVAAMAQATGKSAVNLAPTCGTNTIDFVFCTPTDLLFGDIAHAGPVIRKLWKALMPIATSLVTLLFLIRVSRMMREGPQSIGREGTELVIDFIVTMVLINGAYYIWGSACVAINWFVRSIFAAFGDKNPLTITELTKIAGNKPSFGVSITQTIFLVVMLWLVIKGLVRMIKLAVLFSIAPVMGALYFDRTTRSRFTAWSGRIIDVLLEQVVWAFFIVVGGLFLQYGNGSPASIGDATNRVVANILASIVLGMAIGGEGLMAGIAGATSHSLGLGSLVAARAAGMGMRSVGGALRSAGAAGGAGATGAGAGAGAAAGGLGRGGKSVATLPPSARAGGDVPTLRTSDAADGAAPGHVAQQAVGGAGVAVTGATTRLPPGVTPPPPNAPFQAKEAFSSQVSQRLRAQAAVPGVGSAQRAGLLQKAQLHDRIAKHGNAGIAWKPGMHSARQPDGTFALTDTGKVARHSYQAAARRVTAEDARAVRVAKAQLPTDTAFLHTTAPAHQQRIARPVARPQARTRTPARGVHRVPTAPERRARIAAPARATRRLAQQVAVAQQRVSTNTSTIGRLTPSKSPLTGAEQPRSMATGARIRAEGQRDTAQVLARNARHAALAAPVERREAPVRLHAAALATRFQTQATTLRQTAQHLRGTAQDGTATNPSQRTAQLGRAAQLEQHAQRADTRQARYQAVADRPRGQVPVPAAPGTPPNARQQERRAAFRSAQQQVAQRHVASGTRVTASQLRTEAARVARQQLGERAPVPHVTQVQQRAAQQAQTAPARAAQQARTLRNQAAELTMDAGRAGQRTTQQRLEHQAQQLEARARRAEARPARYQAVAQNPVQALRPLWTPEERTERKAAYAQSYQDAQRLAAAAPQAWTTFQVRAKAKELAQDRLGDRFWADTRKREQGRG